MAVVNVTVVVGAATPQFFARIETLCVPGTANGSETESPRTSVWTSTNPARDVTLVRLTLCTRRVTIHSFSGAAICEFVRESQRMTMFVGELVPLPKKSACPAAGTLMIGWPMFGAEAHANPAGGGGWYANPKPDAMPDASG
jgi:hypothetical protein